MHSSQCSGVHSRKHEEYNSPCHAEFPTPRFPDTGAAQYRVTNYVAYSELRVQRNVLMIQNFRARFTCGCLDRTEVDRPWAKHTIDTELLRSKNHCQQWVLQHIQFLVLRTA